MKQPSGYPLFRSSYFPETTFCYCQLIWPIGWDYHLLDVSFAFRPVWQGSEMAFEFA
jgi:hypothetical protein